METQVSFSMPILQRSFPNARRVNKIENEKRVDERALAERSFRIAVLCLSIFNAYFNELLLFSKTEYHAVK